jgi:hypothetical protein
VNWKRIAKHALLLLVVGIGVGVVEAGVDFTELRLPVTTYLAGEVVSLLGYAAIFAHMAFRLTNQPWVHAVLAALLSEGLALAILLFIPGALGGTPPALILLELATLSIALIGGTVLGTRMRRNRLSKTGPVASAPGGTR